MEIVFSFLSDYKNILLVLLCLSTLVQLFYFFFFYFRFVFHKPAPANDQKVKVSVIICAKNEADNLSQNLSLVLEQDYADFEVIVVNDGSSDGTEILIHDFRQKYSHLRTTNIPEDRNFSHAKKLAVTVGIKAAKYEWLLFTDADCKPESNQWIQTMKDHFTDKNSIVLGYGGYLREKGLLNNYIRFETVYIALQYMSFALGGFPYMAVGRNMAYRKALFFENKGFSNHHHVLSGDDDLFINDVATGQNTDVEFRSLSHTRSLAEKTLKQFVKQKRRHLTTPTYYKTKNKFLLGLESFSRILFYVSGIWLLSINHLIIITLPVFALRELLFLIVYKTAMNKLKEKKLLLTSLIFDILVPLFNGFLLLTNGKTVKKNNSWK